MQPKDAVESLLSMAEKLLLYSEEMPTHTVYDRMKFDSVVKICNEISSLMVILCSDMGTKKQVIRYLSVSELGGATKGGLHCLVIPSELSEVEVTALQRWTKKLSKELHHRSETIRGGTKNNERSGSSSISGRR